MVSLVRIVLFGRRTLFGVRPSRGAPSCPSFSNEPMPIQHIPVATMVLQTSSAVFDAGEQADLGYQSRHGDLK